MELIKSFTINHDEHHVGIYMSHEDDGIYTFDLRFKEPNGGDYLTTGEAHTIEHLLATVMRNDLKDSVVYVGPMGCRTGMYVLLKNINPNIINAVFMNALKKCLDFEEVPGSKKEQCGNYLDHDLVGAKKQIKKFIAAIV